MEGSGRPPLEASHWGPSPQTGGLGSPSLNNLQGCPPRDCDPCWWRRRPRDSVAEATQPGEVRPGGTKLGMFSLAECPLAVVPLSNSSLSPTTGTWQDGASYGPRSCEIINTAAVKADEKYVNPGSGPGQPPNPRSPKTDGRPDPSPGPLGGPGPRNN